MVFEWFAIEFQPVTIESVREIKMLSIIVLEVSVILVGRVIDGSIWLAPRISRKLAWEALESQVKRSMLKSPNNVKDLPSFSIDLDVHRDIGRGK